MSSSPTLSCAPSCLGGLRFCATKPTPPETWLDAELPFSRCVNMIGNLFNAPIGEGTGAVGTSCVGSSEAIILGVLAMKRRWKNKRKAEGKSTENPNIVMNSAVSKIQPA